MAARDLGIRIGRLDAGPNDAITDVRGVRVGHTTLIDGEGPLVVGRGPVRTGVTVILAHEADVWAEPVFAGCHRLNGNGELTGPRVDPRGGPARRPDRDHQHPQRRRRPRRPGRQRDRASTGGRRPVVAARRRGDVGRAAQRHRRPPRPARARRRGDRRRRGRPGHPGQRRGRDRHGLPRVQGRHRVGVAGRGRERRRLDGGRAGPGQLRRARPAARRRRPGRPRDPRRRRPEPVHPCRRHRPRPCRAGFGLDHHHRRHRCAAAAAPVRAAGPASHHGPGAHGQHREPLVGRHRPRVRDGQPRPRDRPTSRASPLP